jgi:cytoskeletal protein CcmA (bactofilin family)
MSYIVYTSSGTILTTVPTGKVNTNTTSLTLIGRDVTNYGRYYNQNLVYLLGNFANELPPKNPIAGQLWYDLDLHKLKIYDSEFRPLNSFPVTDFQPIGQEPGEFWYDTERHELDFMDDDGQYQTLTSYPREQISGWKHPYEPIKNDGTGTSAVVQDVTLLKVYGRNIGALSTSSFTASLKDSTSTFYLANTTSFRVAAGLTIIGELQTTVGTFDTVTVRGNTQAVSTTTGALTVQGGASVRGNLHVGGEIVAQKLTVELTTVTTTIVETDDVITTVNDTESLSTTTGALVVVGGSGIGGNLNVGGYGHFAGTFDESTTTVGVFLGVAGSVPASPRIAFAASTGTNWEIDNYGGVLRVFQPTGVALSINETTATVSKDLTVEGGVQFNGGLNIGSTTTVGGSIIPTATELYDLGSPDFRFKTLYISSATIDFGNNVTIRGTEAGGLAVQHIESEGTSTFQTVIVNGSHRINSTLRVVGRTTLGTTTCTSFFVQNATVGQNFLVNGAIYSRGNITAYYGSASDERFKENIRNIENALEKVKSINGVTFDWTEDYLAGEKEKSGIDLRKHDLGVIAQEVEAVTPEVVDTREDGFKFVKYEKLAGLLIEAIKELDTKLEDIKKHIGM